MKKFSIKEKMGYRIDKLLSKGTAVLILALFIITLAVVLIGGLTIVLVDPEFSTSTGGAIWNTFMYSLDAGTLAGYSNNFLGIIILGLVTLCGIFITSMLIGILTSGFEAKLEALRKGTSRVIERDHTVIVGYNHNVFAILNELIEANANAKNPVIVVLGNLDKMQMEQAISEQVTDPKSTTIICRSGASYDTAALDRCSLQTCGSVIINEENDADTIKAILAVNHILKSDDAQNCTAYITANINDAQNVQAAEIAGEGRAEILFFKDAISRIMANTCHQPGLSKVYTELFDFGGDEIYIEDISGLTGKTFGEIINLFECSTPLGIKKGDTPMLNPPADTRYESGDRLILLAADDGISIPLPASPQIDPAMLAEQTPHALVADQERLLVLGYNEMLPMIVDELDHYVEKGSVVTVTAEELSAEEVASLSHTHENITVCAEQCDIHDRDVLTRFVTSNYEHIIVLSKMDCDIEEADAQTLMILLHLKDIKQKNGLQYSVISQMLSATNGSLAKIANVNDFVVSSNLTALMISQISENRDLSAIFRDILDADGSELYMKPAQTYVKLHQPVTMFAACAAASRKNEVVIGYKRLVRDEQGNIDTILVTNPKKSDLVTFTEQDMLLLLSEEGAY